jgi:hypothetical protein
MIQLFTIQTDGLSQLSVLRPNVFHLTFYIFPDIPSQHFNLSPLSVYIPPEQLCSVMPLRFHLLDYNSRLPTTDSRLIPRARFLPFPSLKSELE